MIRSCTDDTQGHLVCAQWDGLTTLTQPTAFSSSTQSLDPLLWDESSYLICATWPTITYVCPATQTRMLLQKVMGLRYKATLNRSPHRHSPSPYLIPKKRSFLTPGPAVSSHHSSILIAPDSAPNGPHRPIGVRQIFNPSSLYPQPDCSVDIPISEPPSFRQYS